MPIISVYFSISNILSYLLLYSSVEYISFDELCFVNDALPEFISRYLLEHKWFKQWKKYVGFDTWETLDTGEPTANPGPIDNSALLKGSYNYKTMSGI